MFEPAFILSVLSLLCSIFAISLTWMNSRRAKQEAEVNLMLQLRADYETIRAKMDTRYRDESWIPDRTDKTVWGPLEEYWYLSFREWRITRGRYEVLWEDEISKGVKAGLRHRPLRYVLATIRKEGSLTDEYAGDFIEELVDSYGSDFQKEFYPPVEGS